MTFFESVSWLLIRLLGTLPLTIRVILGRLTGRIVFLFSSKDKLVSRLQLELLLPKVDSKKNTAKMYQSLGQSALETINLTPYLKNPERYIECEGFELLNQTSSSAKQGVLILSGHIGNWDLCGGYLIRRGLEVATVARRARGNAGQNLLDLIRKQYGMETLWRSDLGGTREIVKKLKSGQIVSALIDQDIKGKGIFCPFFGLAAKYPSSLIEIAKRHSAKIVTCFIVRTGFTNYRIMISEVDCSRSVEEILGIFNSRFEEVISKYPWQWVWMHKRWRSFPDGTCLGSKKYIEYLQDKLKPESKHTVNA